MKEKINKLASNITDNEIVKTVNKYSLKSMASAIRICGIIIILWSLIAGIMFAESTVVKYNSYNGMASNETVFLWSLAFMYWITGSVIGILIIGFSEVITLLKKIYLCLNNSDAG